MHSRNQAPYWYFPRNFSLDKIMLPAFCMAFWKFTRHIHTHKFFSLLSTYTWTQSLQWNSQRTTVKAGRSPARWFWLPALPTLCKISHWLQEFAKEKKSWADLYWRLIYCPICTDKLECAFCNKEVKSQLCCCIDSFAKWAICTHSLIKLFYSTGKYDSHPNSKEACTITVLHNTASRTVLTKIYHFLTN